MNDERNSFLMFFSVECFVQNSANIIKKFLGQDSEKYFLADCDSIELSLLDKLWRLNILPKMKSCPSLMFASYVFEIATNHFKFVKKIIASVEAIKTYSNTDECDNLLYLLEPERLVA